MNKIGKILIVIVLAVIVSSIIISKQNRPSPGDIIVENNTESIATETSSKPSKTEANIIQPRKTLPRLVDLGAKKCIPCKMMAPILEELKQEYADRFQVEFIDVWEKTNAGKEYGIKIIPTQIFYDASGKELFRHEGFFSKEDILEKWKALGVNLDAELP